MSSFASTRSVMNLETEIEMHRVIYNWDIKHFERICPPDTQDFEPFTSNSFRAGEDIGRDSEWAFTLDNEDGYLQLWLHIEKIFNEHETEVTAHMTMAIVKADGSTAYRRRCTKNHSFSPGTESNGWGLSNIIRIQKLWDERDEYLSDSTLRLQITVDILGDFVYNNKTKLRGTKRKRDTDSECPSDTECESTSLLGEQMGDLLKSQKGTDFTIQCGLKLFPVHKLVITARSKVFAAMLEHDTLELQSSLVKIKDIHPDTIESIIDYIYTGKVQYPSDIEMLISLLQAADKYELNHLKNRCFYKLYLQISMENVGKFAVLAYLHNAEPEVVEEIRTYYRNNWDALVKKESFKECLIAKPAAFFEATVESEANESSD